MLRDHENGHPVHCRDLRVHDLLAQALVVVVLVF